MQNEYPSGQPVWPGLVLKGIIFNITSNCVGSVLNYFGDQLGSKVN